MGYQISIGEASVHVEWGERRAWIDVEYVGADEDDNPTGRCNWIESGYNEWSDFARRIGLYKMFYGMRDNNGDWWRDDEGVGHDDLMYRSQYAAPITEGHYMAFAKAKEEYRSDADQETQEDDMFKLDFLIAWTRWSLDHAKFPTFSVR